MKKLFADARLRLAWRAVLIGVGAFVVYLQSADDPTSTAVWKGAVAAGIAASVEAFTPLNALVGWFKNPT